MANPFGSNDETLTVNGQYSNAVNLIYAVIPRSATKFVEVVNGSVLQTTGVYDSDGYWYTGDNVRKSIEFDNTAGLRCGNTHTIITGWYRDSTAGTQDFEGRGGLRNTASSAGSFANMTVDGVTVQSRAVDNSFNTGPLGSITTTSNTVLAMVHKHNSAGPEQRGWRRVGGSNTNLTTTTATLTTTTADLFNKVGCRTASKWRFQYLFVYNAYLEDSVINDIMDTPANVITVGSGSTYAPTLFTSPRRHGFMAGSGY